MSKVLFTNIEADVTDAAAALSFVGKNGGVTVAVRAAVWTAVTITFYGRSGKDGTPRALDGGAFTADDDWYIPFVGYGYEIFALTSGATTGTLATVNIHG